MARKIPYYNRNFADFRQSLINYVKQYYPEIFSSFNDASIGAMLIDLNAAIGDNLAFHTDRQFQETQINYAQERSSVLSMARTFGLKEFGKKPSMTVVDFSVIVPVDGDTFDLSYAPIIRQGAQVSGAGKVFETVDDIDFSSPFALGGLPNRTIVPNFDSSGNIINYTLTKRELAVNGITKVFKRVMNQNDVRPFFTLTLPDNDVISINSIVTLEGTGYNQNPTIDQFLDSELRWFEMQALAEDTVFIRDNSEAASEFSTLRGKWIRTDRRFIKEYTDRGFVKLIFGGGSQDIGSICDFNIDSTIVNRIGDFINNLSLGQTVEDDSTMFISYRVGGGANTNIGPNTITTVNTVNMFVNGLNPAINTQVRNSLRVNNPIPSVGGKDEPSVEEIRNLVRYNFSSQNRAVVLNDYRVRIGQMPGEFGVPFRVGLMEVQNKVVIHILNLNQQGKLSNQGNSVLMQNIADYLSNYRMMNDYVEILNGKIVNLGFEIGLFIDKQFPKTQIIAEAVNVVKNYMDIKNFEMGETIYLSQLIENLNNVGGVLNVMEMKVFNKVGGNYSLNEISQPLLNETTGEIDISQDFALIGNPVSLYEVKFPATDLRFRVKTN